MEATLRHEPVFKLLVAFSASVAGAVVYETLTSESLAQAGLLTDLGPAYHVTLHSITLALGGFLVYTSWTAYARTRRTRLLAVSFAFTFLALKELVILASTVSLGGDIMLTGSRIELSHLIDLPAIMLFSIGTIIR